jgi:V8-like Glu-specific endopeptidase
MNAKKPDLVSLLVPAALAFAALSGVRSFASAPNVFGPPDPRQPVLKLEGPTQFIGRLQLPGGGICTAGLVHKNLIITAAHCIMTQDGQFIRGRYQFQYGLIHNQWRDEADVTWFQWGTNRPESAEHKDQDWAIGKLAKPLGAKYGWMGYRTLQGDELLGQTIGVTGYGTDYEGGATAMSQWGCRFVGFRDNGNVGTDCSITRGGSGAPMYRRVTYPDGHVGYEVLAVWTTERRYGDKSLVNIPYDDAHTNVAVPASRFVPALLRLASEDP